MRHLIFELYFINSFMLFLLRQDTTGLNDYGVATTACTLHIRRDLALILSLFRAGDEWGHTAVKTNKLQSLQ